MPETRFSALSRNHAWMCPALALLLAAAVLMLFGLSVWTALVAALLLACPAMVVWGLFAAARDSRGRNKAAATTCCVDPSPSKPGDEIMPKAILLAAAVGASLVLGGTAQAHCDAIGGPVTTAAVRALDTNNVHAVLPYVPASAEPELTATFTQAMTVRAGGPDAKALADRFFMETAVRLHRAGEGAPYTGLKPADTDFGPAIPAAEQALATGKVEPLLEFLSREIEHGVRERFAHAAGDKPKEPTGAAEVPAAREHVQEELGFIGYVEAIYLATKGSGHAAGPAAAEACRH
ncbi:DUF6448 family protein [Microvirga sp. G4-2]|uniref:DUF6448 family protein n=1 Tax=Microvirga sp. G4-2 TaxID=3434467 RepID=UPI004043E8EA